MSLQASVISEGKNVTDGQRGNSTESDRRYGLEQGKRLSLPQEADELSTKQESGEPGGSAHQIPRRHGNARHDDRKAHEQKSSAGGGKAAKTFSNALFIR